MIDTRCLSGVEKMCRAGQCSRTTDSGDYDTKQEQVQMQVQGRRLAGSAVLEQSNTRTVVGPYTPDYTAAELANTASEPAPTAACTHSTVAIADSALAMAAAPSSAAGRSDTDSTCTADRSIPCYPHRKDRRAHRDRLSLRPEHLRPWLALMRCLFPWTAWE